MSEPRGGHDALTERQAPKVLFRLEAFFFFFYPLRTISFHPWKDLRGLYLDQSVLDDPAHVQPPLCNVGVVVVQVGREGQQVGSEILCKVEDGEKVRD